MARRYYSSTAVATTLSASANNSTTSITVTALSGFPVSTPWTAIIDPDTASEEVVEVTNVAGTTLTVTRGVDGTSATSHSAGAVFRHGVSGRDFDEANSHVNDTSTDVHSQYVLKSLVSGKGSLIAASADDTPADLPVGANEYRLVAASGETTGLKYVADTTNYAIGAKGDLLVGTAADTLTNVAVGTNGHVLTADSTEAAGVKWAAAASGSPILAWTQTTTGQSTTSTSYVDIGAPMTVTFTAPSSGKVLLQAEFTGGVSGGNQDAYLAWRDNSTSATIADRIFAGLISDNADTRQRIGAIVTGLTPGTSYTYKISIKSGNAIYTVRTLGVHLLLVSAVD